MRHNKKKQKKSKAERQREHRINAASASITVILLPLPMVGYCVCVYFLFQPFGYTAFSFLGIIGTFCLGVMLSYIANEKLYRRKISFRGLLPLLLVSVSFTAVSLMCLYLPPVAQLFDGNYVAVYFTLWLILIFDAVCYILFFRIPMRAWLRQEKGIRGFGRALKGWQSLLWYRDIHMTRGIGLIYPVNMLFTFAFSAGLCLHLLLGWNHFGVLPVCVLVGFSGILEAVLLFLIMKALLSDQSGKGYGLFQKTNSGGKIVSGNFAMILYLLATAVISFGLPSLIHS